MTLRSAVRPRRALAFHLGHSRVTCVSLQLHLSFCFLSRAHFFHLWGTWSAKRPVNASILTCQGLKASFYEAFTNSLFFFTKALPILVPLISFQCLSFPSVVSSQPFPGHFPCSKPTVWPMTEQRRPTLMPLSVILLPIYVSSKTIGYFLWVLYFLLQDFRFHIFHFCIYPTTWLIIAKWSRSGWINISIIKISNKILKKKFFFIASV